MLGVEQLSFFARNGYLQVPGLVADDYCAELVEETWRLMPAAWRRDQPSDWRGPVADSCHRASVAARGGHLKFQQGRYQPLPAIDRAFGLGSRCADAARALLGERLAPVRERGLYVVVPTASSWWPRSPAHHIESHAVQTIALAYLQEVAPGAGGLLVWPGSHRALYPLMASKLEYVATPAFDRAYADWSRRQPVELPGRRGDVIFIHHRLVHAPSRNRSRAMRFGFLCDYMRYDFRALCAQPPGADLWADWDGIARLDPEELARPADTALAWAWRVGWRPKASGAVDLVNKADESALARGRQPGEVWLVLADTDVGWNDTRLGPRGGNLVRRGLQVEVDGRPVASVSTNGFVARIDVRSAAAWRITVRNAPCELWLKVVALRLPFGDSRRVHAARLGAGTHNLQASCESADA